LKTFVNLERVARQLHRLPRHIFLHLNKWMNDVERIGISEVRKRKGLHDEPLQGARWGQRSIRLSRSYRAIYIVSKKSEVEILYVIEVSKHEY
jgi:proteic killer suppression protein